MRVFFIFIQVFVKFGFNFRDLLHILKVKLRFNLRGATMVASRRKIIMSSIFAFFRAGLSIKSSFY